MSEREPTDEPTWPHRHLRELDSDPSEPAIVFVPGIDGTALFFYRQAPLLADRFDVVAFPLPDDPDLDMADLVDDLRMVIEEVSPDGAILVGESFGGALSMSTALAHPELVRGLVVINSFPWFDQRLQLRLAPRLMKLVPWAAMPLVRRLTEHRLHSSHTSDEDLAEFRERSRQVGRRGYIRRLEVIADYDLRDHLTEIQPPTLFLAADEDQLVPSVRWARYMADLVPSSSMSVLEGHGHVCLINHDLDLRDHIVPWWNRVRPRSLDQLRARGR